MKAKTPLTDRAIRGLKPAPAGKRMLRWDAQVPGLAVRVSDTGTKSFVLVVRYPGERNPSSRALGVYGAMSLETARIKGREWLAHIANGVDPKIKEATRRADTLRAIAEVYLERESRLRTIDQRQSILERLILPKLGARPIADIRRVEIVALLDRIEDERGPAMAQYTLATLRRVFSWHAGRSDDFRSPVVRGMSRVRPSEQRRERTLTDDEIRAVWRATDGSVFGCFVQFLLLTAVRRNEAARMRRSEVVGDDWVIPPDRYKTNKELVIPLSPAAKAMLAKIPQIGNAGFVFTTNGKTPISGFGKFKQALDEASGTSGWTIHDLRRTARSLMSRAGVPSDHAERALGHVIGGIRGTYDRFAYRDEKAWAFAALAGQIERIRLSDAKARRAWSARAPRA
jgi:integrase